MPLNQWDRQLSNSEQFPIGEHVKMQDWSKVGLRPLKQNLLGPFARVVVEHGPWCMVLICALLAGACGGAPQGLPAIPAVPKALKIPGLPKLGGSKKPNTKFTMQINVSDAANQNQPIPMDLVMVLDKRTVLQVAKLTSKDWFDRRMQVERDNPGKVVVASWEWSPGEHVGPISVDISPDFRAGFIFASYANDTDHRAVIDVRKPIVVNLQAEDFSVTSLK